MSDSMTYSAAILLGLFSAPHCVAMCGGLVSAMGLHNRQSSKSAKLMNMLKYNGGRLLSYTLMGLVVGALGATLVSVAPQTGMALRVFAAVLMVMCGFYISGWWLGLRHFEQALSGIGNRLQGIFTPKQGVGGAGILLAGVTWGCLPCGLVYSALTMAMTQQTPWQGALFMLSFGLGTLPVMVGVGMVSASFGSYLKHKWVRAGAGLALIVFGIWTAVGILTMDHGDHETQGGHHDHHAGHQM